MRTFSFLIAILRVLPLRLFWSKSTVVNSYKLVGNLTYWDSIFSSRVPEFVAETTSQTVLSWTEGPLWYENGLIFSDTIENKIFHLSLDFKNIRILEANSGDALTDEMLWRAEPGSNGIANLRVTNSGHWVVVCQHGARRLVALNLHTGQRVPLIEIADNGKRLNGPNDVIVRSESDGIFVYFTDPVYAWLEKDRFEDLPYLDMRVENDGPGYCGVYRSRINFDIKNPKEAMIQPNVELIAKMDRPNGIDFLKNPKNSDILVVSDCCQGKHKVSCQQGTSRWIFYQKKDNKYEHISTITDVSAPRGGCSDGFKSILGLHGENILISSCSGGLCIVDVDKGQVVAKLLTGLDDHSTDKKNEQVCKFSNVALSPREIFLTGNCGILKVPLQGAIRYDYGVENEL